MKLILTMILSTFFIADQVFSDLEGKSSVSKKKKLGFLDGIKADNPEAQNEINQLKKEFYKEREKINQRYELRIKDLKKNRKNEVDRLKKKYKQRMKRLRKEYPSIPKIVDIDPKPMPKPKPPKDRGEMKSYKQNKEDRKGMERKDVRREKRYRIREEMRLKESLNKDSNSDSKAKEEKSEDKK